MLPYGVGDHVFFKEGEEGDSGPWDDNDWVVVHIAGSELMLKRGHLIICGIHADQVALCRASGDDDGVAGSASPRPEGAACGPAHSGTQRADAAVVILPAGSLPSLDVTGQLRQTRDLRAAVRWAASAFTQQP